MYMQYADEDEDNDFQDHQDEWASEVCKQPNAELLFILYIRLLFNLCDSI